MKPKRLFVPAAAVFMLLILVKILGSGLLLTGTSLDLTGTAALAGDETGQQTPPPAETEQALLRKEQRLREWEEELREREEQIRPLQKEIDRKMAELEEIQSDLTAFAKKLAEREQALNDTQVKHLVSLYQSMEPERAAAIMGKLDVPTVVRILGNMRGKSAGQILASMPPERGAAISEQLSRTE
jgi:flagellar motility protein MotE (MotC chaperone)